MCSRSEASLDDCRLTLDGLELGMKEDPVDHHISQFLNELYDEGP